METKKVALQRKRIFSEEFKKARVREYESGKFTVSELSRLFKIKGTIIYRWIHKYSMYNKHSVRIVEIEQSGTKKLKDLELKIKELEQIVGQKQLKIDYLEKMIELADQKFDIDIKKNSNTPLFGGSITTNLK